MIFLVIMHSILLLYLSINLQVIPELYCQYDKITLMYYILLQMSQSYQTNIESHILTRYNIIKKIGQGAYGHVWKIQDKINKKTFALKKIFDAFQHSTDAQRTYREIQILKQIQHNNIIKLYQIIKAENNKDVYLVFQFMEADLHHVISQGILKQIHIRFVLYQLAKALKYLHSGLIIHRDLKPSNILINSNCTIKLCDFGLVRSLIGLNQNQLNLTEGVATRWYRAPEILLGSTNYSAPADIWSLGCIIYEIYVKKPMFAGDSTTDQINKIFSYTGYPTQQQIKGLKSNNAKTMLKQSSISSYTQSSKQKLLDLPHILGQLISRMTVLNPNQRITVEEILNHEAVAPFRKKQQEISCQKIITTQVSDNKKLTVEQYRNLIYGIKETQQSVQNNQTKPGTKKSSSSAYLNKSHNYIQKPTLKYAKSRQMLASKYNKQQNLTQEQTLQLKKEEKNPSKQQYLQQKKEETTDESRKQIVKDPTKIASTSKKLYSPQGLQSIKSMHNYSNSYTPRQSLSSQSHTCSNLNKSNQALDKYSQTGTKIGSYTSSNASHKKQVLFKSSKYMMNKTQQSSKQ